MDLSRGEWRYIKLNDFVGILILLVSADVADLIYQIHRCYSDNEIRYIKEIVVAEYPNGEVEVVRREKCVGLLDCVRIKSSSPAVDSTSDSEEEKEEEEEESSDDEDSQHHKTNNNKALFLFHLVVLF